MKDLKERINELGLQLCASSLKKGVPYNDYEVYIPQYPYKKGVVHYIGLPLVILVKDGTARISTPEECRDYLDFELSLKTRKNRARKTHVT